MTAGSEVNLERIESARRALRGIVQPTPLIRSRFLSEQTGGQVFLKAENLQRTGSFKIRGAYYRMLRLTDDERSRGVIAASAGNHAQGVAWAAGKLGIRATIVMPETAAIAKVEATRAYGAEVLLHGNHFDEAMTLALEICRTEGRILIHAFDDPDVIAGQGTLALELLEELKEMDYVLVPIGGGGLLAGMGTVLKSLCPHIRLIGVESRYSNSMYRSLQEGKPISGESGATLADGLAVKYPSERTLKLAQRVVDDIVVVEEEDIPHAILFLLERARLVVEGAGAVGVAALLSGRVKISGNGIAVLTGGNIDVNRIARVIEHGLASEGRFLRLKLRLADRPGSLQALLKAVADLGANVLSVEHDRLHPGVPVGMARVTLLVEARNHGHSLEIREHLKQQGYRLEEKGNC